MRRSDREVTGLTNILGMLDKCEVIRIGLCADDKPYIVPMDFACQVIDEKVSIYIHCAAKGRKLDIIARNKNVCFEADCCHQTIEAAVACGWSAKYQSVIGEGTVSIVTDEIQKIAALDILMKRYGFEGKPHYKPEQLAAVTLLKISVLSITGKCST